MGRETSPTKPLRAVVALLIRGNSILLCHRHPNDAIQGWCLPGGKIDPGETPEQAVLRELKEETGLRGYVIRSWGKYNSLSRQGQTYQVEVFRVGEIDTFAQIQFSEREHQDVRWVDLAEAWKLPLAGPVTRSVVNQSILYWPLAHVQPSFPDAPGQFGAVRKFNVHTGVDLYCELGTLVVAMEAGKVISIEHFTGTKANPPSPWWNDTQAVLVRGNHGVWVYGEVTPRVIVGDHLEQGDIVGVVDRPVLKKDKGRPTTMLHLELMRHEATSTVSWNLGEKQPEILEDPTPLLKFAASGIYL